MNHGAEEEVRQTISAFHVEYTVSILTEDFLCLNY